MVPFGMAEQMNICAIEFPPEVDELRQAGLETIASVKVAPPRIAGCPVAFECELFKVVDVTEERAILLGKPVLLHVEDRFVLDPVRCHIDTPRLEQIGRMHGAGWYAKTTDLFKIDRIPVNDWELI